MRPPVPEVGGEEACAAGISGVENSRKRARDEFSAGPKSKACREKMRRDKLNDRFSELSSILDPGAPKSDKASILSDVVRILTQLKAPAEEEEELKKSNEKLQEMIKFLKVEKDELRDEMKLRLDKEKLEQQIKAMTMTPASFIPHPLTFHPAAAAPAAFAPGVPAPNKAAHFPAYPGMAMWQWLPPAVMDTTQDTKLWPPHA
ncbi:transcription factor ILR3-like [Zingiber officinale]|uniref:transcription factor ILR3-like n=1 Tax=Zingiber officinale TaxID=94328 RepID=UPI001C4C6BC7|nr:transcription factor ILR3-like [Zingiber officinale]